MEFIVSRNALLLALQHARTVITKGPLDIFKNFVLSFSDDPKENTMTIHASDGSIWISETVTLEKPAVEPRPIAVWYSDFIRSVKSLDEQPLQFIVGEMQMTVKHSCGSFRLPLTNEATEFLQIPRPCPDVEAPDCHTFEYEAPALLSILNRCNFAMAQDELRPVMNGVYINLTEEYSDYVSSDGHKLVRVRKDPVKSDNKTILLSLIIPSRVVKCLLKVSPPTGDVVFEYQEELVEEKTRIDKVTGLYKTYESQVRKPMARIIIDDIITVSFNPVDGAYPRYWHVIPDNNVFQTTIERKKLIKSIDRLSLFQPISGLVKINISKDEMCLCTADKDFELEGEELLSCESVRTDGGKLMNNSHFIRIGMKCSSFSQTLKALSSENVVLGFTDASRAVIIQPVPQPDVEDITMLLMPMMFDD